MFANAPAKDQNRHWDEVYGRNREFFGQAESGFARKALAVFQEGQAKALLELGPGQGRDTLFFARNGFAVVALDYSGQAMAELSAAAQAQGLASRVTAQAHDIRLPLPCPDESFDLCYSHMLLCMHLTRQEVASAIQEMRRVLRPGGIVAYSVRSVFDKHHGAGQHLGEAIYAVEGFVVHFFSEAMIRDLAQGFAITEISRMEEGSLPRDLLAVFMKKLG